MNIYHQTQRLEELLDDEKFETTAELYASDLPYTRVKLIDSLNNLEECLMVVEVESKGWHDFWVVLRAVCRALYVILMWIIRHDKNVK